MTVVQRLNGGAILAEAELFALSHVVINDGNSQSVKPTCSGDSFAAECPAGVVVGITSSSKPR